MSEQIREMLWAPSAERIANSKMARYQRWLAQTHGVHTTDFASLWRWSVDHRGPFWSSIWEYFDVLASQTAEVAVTDDAMPGTRWFPGARLNWAQNLLRPTGHRQSGDHLRRRERHHRAAVANRARRTGRQPRRTSTAGRRPTRRPGRRRPTQHRPSRRCGAGLRQRRGRVVLLRTGFRAQRVGRPVRADRADRTDRRRRLQLRGQTGGPPRADRRAAQPAAVGAAHHHGAQPRPGRRVARGRHRLRRDDHRRRGAVLRAGAFRASAVDPLQLRHHRPAQRHRPLPRRNPARIAESQRPALRPRPRRPGVHRRLDGVGGVEHARRRDGHRRHHRYLRRQPHVRAPGPPVRALRAASRDAFRHRRCLFGPVRQGRRHPRRTIRPLRIAHDDVHRLTAARLDLALGVPPRERRRPPRLRQWRYRRRHRIRWRQPHFPRSTSANCRAPTSGWTSKRGMCTAPR